MYEISIVIPVYKEFPDRFEIISLMQCLKILNDHTITFIAPEGLNISYYETLAARQSAKCRIEKFDEQYFQSIAGYNKLMLSRTFYSRFLQYQYILIYQLDCFVFRDELAYWCGLGYDYIGAPWVNKTRNEISYWGVGNGGLSLRNPLAINTILLRKSLRMNFLGCYKLYCYWDFKGLMKVFKLIEIPARFLGYRNNKKAYLQAKEINEDLVLGFVLKYSNYSFKIPEPTEALKFAFDREPQLLYELNNFKLPFGCHDWYKYKDHLDFYRPFIKNENFIIDE